MRELIIKNLNSIEKEENIRILYACEAGSRAYGTETAESDYDVRFIYMRPLRAYISIVQSERTISRKSPFSVEYHGWDIFKAFELCRKSNPALYEWFFSPCIYLKDEFFYINMKQIIYSGYSLQVLFRHYQSLAQKNIKELKRKETGSKAYVKTFLQALRGVMAMRWIAKRQSLPPLSVKQLADGDQYIEEMINVLVKAKTMDVYAKHIPKESFFNEMLHSLPDYFQKQTSEPEGADVQKLNELLWTLLKI
jgi:uncharacterized protein